MLVLILIFVQLWKVSAGKDLKDGWSQYLHFAEEKIDPER